jgi:hypothetical protein
METNFILDTSQLVHDLLMTPSILQRDSLLWLWRNFTSSDSKKTGTLKIKLPFTAGWLVVDMVTVVKMVP